MTRSAKALMNPKLLRWAREESAFDLNLAAHKLEIKPDQLEEWENGISNPTFNQLLAIAKLYKRPVTLFYLSDPPKGFMILTDYRKLPEFTSEAFQGQTPELNFEIRKAHYRRQVAIDLNEMLSDGIISKFNFRIDRQQSAEELGHKIRKFLKVTIEAQKDWKTEYDALNAWRSALEDKGVLVFQSEKVTVKEMRGFAIAERPFPVVVVNKKDTVRGRIFSILHEFSHILLGDSSISGSDDNKVGNDARDIEVFCNHIAAATLLPLNALQSDMVYINQKHLGKWTDDAIEQLSKKFKVSQEFIWRRLLASKDISVKLYKEKRKEIQDAFLKYQEQEKPSSGGPRYHIKVLSSIGSLYPRLVLNSYHQEKITSSSLSEYLGVKLKHLEKIERSIFGPQLT